MHNRQSHIFGIDTARPPTGDIYAKRRWYRYRQVTTPQNIRQGIGVHAPTQTVDGAKCGHGGSEADTEFPRLDHAIFNNDLVRTAPGLFMAVAESVTLGDYKVRYGGTGRFAYTIRRLVAEASEVIARYRRIDFCAI